ncbi:MAG: T9SS type A sorting domain-containing protein, partial [Flavobacteriales bacterium]
FSSTSRQIAIRMYDATGKSVLEKRADVLAGSINRIPVAVKSIVAPGIYLLEVDAGEIVSRSKLIVSE